METLLDAFAAKSAEFRHISHPTFDLIEPIHVASQERFLKRWGFVSRGRTAWLLQPQVSINSVNLRTLLHQISQNVNLTKCLTQLRWP